MVTDRSQFHYFTRWVEWGRRIVCIFGQEAYELDARVGGGVDFHCRESAEDSVEKKILRKRGPKNLSPPSISSLCCCLVRDTRELMTRKIDMQRPLDQRSRSSKPTTIHGCAQSGDLLALQKLLRGNPSLLNDRNPVVRSLILPLSVCPLHMGISRNPFFFICCISKNDAAWCHLDRWCSKIWVYCAQNLERIDLSCASLFLL